MKHCSKCGSQIMDEAIICPKCGCIADYQNEFVIVKKNNDAACCQDNSCNSNWIPLIFGILALISSVFLVVYIYAMSSLTWFIRNFGIFTGLYACGLLAIMSSIKELKKGMKINSLLGLIFGCMSLLTNIITMILSYDKYYYI